MSLTAPYKLEFDAGAAGGSIQNVSEYKEGAVC